MQILFERLEEPLTEVRYKIDLTELTIQLTFSSDDPEDLTNFIKRKLEHIRTNIVCWKVDKNGIVSVGVGHFYTETQFGDIDYPYWWVN